MKNLYNATIITIGDEILIGQIVDTNSAWLASHLNTLGIKVDRIISISDDQTEIYNTLKDSIENSRLTFVTGGLGPTKDDITKITLAKIFNCNLIRHQKSYEIVESILSKRGIDFNELNQSQALVPSCCEVVVNNHGTAPGMLFKEGSNLLFSMPGVPFEMIQMCEESIFPILKERLSLKSNIHRTAITFGLPESILAAKISEWEDSLPDYLHLAYLPNPNKVRLRLSAYEMEDSKSVDEEIDFQFEELRKIIPENFIGEEDLEVEQSLSKILISRNETLSVAESCTGGAIASKFTKMAGASKYFLAGVVSYSNEAKINMLSVDSEFIEKYGAVSQQVVEQMAVGIKKITNSTYSIATSGVAGPDGGSLEKPVGTVWIAIATPEGVFSNEYIFGSVREPNIERSASTAIFELRKYILKQSL